MRVISRRSCLKATARSLSGWCCSDRVVKSPVLLTNLRQRSHRRCSGVCPQPLQQLLRTTILVVPPDPQPPQCDGNNDASLTELIDRAVSHSLTRRANNVLALGYQVATATGARGACELPGVQCTFPNSSVAFLKVLASSFRFRAEEGVSRDHNGRRSLN